MYKEKTVCVVVPAYNEETQIGRVIETIPEFVDRIVVVNDGSSDDTAAVVEKYQQDNNKVFLISHTSNQRVGVALITGYKWSLENNYDVTVRMDGDGQMNPDDLESLLDPVVDGQVDYSKGNRLFSGEAYERMPKTRYFGNAFLSLLTKIVSGYWHISDFQSGYTAINKRALDTIDWDKMYHDYGQPNDLLVRLNIFNFKVRDVPVEPVYDVGEQSGIRIYKVIFTISWLLFKLFFWRMKEKYIIRDFHPLIFFYILGVFLVYRPWSCLRGFFTFGLLQALFLLLMLWLPFSFMSTSLFTLFAMWFDMEANKDLK